ncbi:MAG: hypothetical protein QMD01_06300, partial [Thermodesulfovibrionales bacterium]|nr:hypothetical protein [Thermodesulfovibrionales bacterium]
KIMQSESFLLQLKKGTISGSVPQAFLTDYAHVVKEFLGIPETKRLVLGISIGYPDMEDNANSFRTDRININEIVKWIE